LPEPSRTPGTHPATTIPEEFSMLGTILIVVLVLMLVGALPTWNHSRSWGYAPSGVFGLLVIVLLILLLTGRI
jgi:Na+/melibiose symporter-like transporter